MFYVHKVSKYFTKYKFCRYFYREVCGFWALILGQGSFPTAATIFLPLMLSEDSVSSASVPDGLCAPRALSLSCAGRLPLWRR